MKTLTWMIGTLASLALVACGGGGGGGGTTAAAAKGVVTGGGTAVVVNGVTWKTGGAALRVDDSPTVTIADDSDGRQRLRDGMVVTIRGTQDDNGVHQATEIEHRPELAGTLDDHGGTWATVNGKDFAIDDSTRVRNEDGTAGTLDDHVGRRVELSGQPDGNGGLRVTEIRRDDSNEPGEFQIEVKGYVTTVTAGPPLTIAVSLTPGGATVEIFDLSGITPAPTVAVGDLVEVKATDGTRTAGGALLAAALEKEDELRGAAGAQVELEGFVASGTFADFVLGSQRVVTNASTIVRGGVVGDFVVGTKLEVEGVLNDAGTLTATKVTFKDSVRVDAPVQTVTLPAGGPPGVGEFTVITRKVLVSPSTRIDNVALATLAAGDCVQVRGYPAGNGVDLVATRLDASGVCDNDRIVFRGVVTAKTPTTSLTILGLALDTNGTVFSDSRGLPSGTSGPVIGATAFYDAISLAQTVVKVRWDPSTGAPAIPVDEAELESE